MINNSRSGCDCASGGFRNNLPQLMQNGTVFIIDAINSFTWCLTLVYPQTWEATEISAFNAWEFHAPSLTRVCVVYVVKEVAAFPYSIN